MLGNEDKSKEKVNENHDPLVSGPLCPRRLRIKEEIVDDSPRPSPPAVNNEDSSSNTFLKVRVKQEPQSKLAELKRALELNKGISLLLGAEIQRVKVAYEKNLEKQKVLQQIVDEDKDVKVNYKPPSQIRAISVFAAPYFRDVKKMVPPLNEDTKIKRRNQDVNAYLRPPRPWSQEDNKRLLDGVTGFALMSALKPYKIKRDYLKKKLKDQNLLEFEIEVLEKQLLSLEKKIKIVNEKPLVELLEEVEGKIDWLNISAVNLQGEKTPDECENMWNNYLNFKINKEVFTFEEDERLKNLAEDNNERDWDKIAKKLKTNRTPIQCFERFQTRLNPNLRKRYWTAEEDARLKRLVDQYRCGKIIPWNKISLMMEGRTRQQVINRYERSISQLYSRGPWAVEEDAMLIACYHKYGTRWGRMKPFFHRRSTCTLRERYVNSLDPSIKMGNWSKEEDRLLITLIKRYGYGKWAKICKHIPGRTDNMCLVRAGRLLEYSMRYCSEKGLGEYDPGVHDPETFAKIIRPLAPTKDCVYRNMKLKSNREEALELLVNVVKKAVPGVQIDEDNLECIDFSWLSYEILLRISIELHKILEDRIKNGAYVEKKLPAHKFMKKPLPFRKRLFDDTDEEDYVQPSPEKPLPREERKWLTDAMTAQFQVAGKIMCPAKKRKSVNGVLQRRIEEYNGREAAEISLYKAYLYKQFHCQAICDEEDDLENVIFGGVDFSETLQTVVSYFIQPPIYEGQFIVLSPNITNTLAMEVMEATEDRLQSMSKYVSHSKPYVDYICERRRSCPKCLQCLKVENQLPESTREAAEEMASRMQKDLFFVEKTLQQSIDVETSNLDVSNQSCSCEQLRESRNSIKLLRQRFMALFLWPALFAATDFNKEQEESILTAEPKNEDHKNYYYRGNLLTRKSGQNSREKVAKTTTRKRKANKSPSRNTKKAKTSINESSERENLNVSHSNVAVKGKKSQTSKKTPSKQLRQRRQSEPPEGLRRSQRQCVMNRTSFSFSTKTKDSEPKKSKKSLMKICAVPSNALQHLDPNIAVISSESSKCLVVKEEIDTLEGSQQSNLAVDFNQTDEGSSCST